MTYHRLAGTVLCLCLCAAAPATAPSTRAVTASVLDHSSPKALLRTFFVSRGEVDEATLRSLLHASNSAEGRLIDAVVEVEMAHGRLRAAQKEKFGKPATAPAMTPPGLDADTPEEINALQEKVEGDRATVSAPGEPAMSMEFVRVDGAWKLPVGSLIGRMEDASAETLDAATKAQVQIIDAIASDVRSGKLASEDAVRDELTRRFAERLAAVKASTQQHPAPSTLPVAPSERGT